MLKTVRICALLGLALAASASPALAIPHPGDAAPPFTLSATDGSSLTFAALKGKPVYLNFFAAWCGPCRVETPSIVALSRRYAARGLRVVGVDVGEDLDRARSFAKDFKVPYVLAADPDNATRPTYGAASIFRCTCSSTATAWCAGIIRAR